MEKRPEAFSVTGNKQRIFFEKWKTRIVFFILLVLLWFGIPFFEDIFFISHYHLPANFSSQIASKNSIKL
jgi:hypothetical protein